CSHKPVDKLSWFQSSFADLRELHLDHLRVSSTAMQTLKTSCPRLESLTIENLTVSDCREEKVWFSNLAKLPTLTHLFIGTQDWEAFRTDRTFPWSLKTLARP